MVVQAIMAPLALNSVNIIEKLWFLTIDNSGNSEFKTMVAFQGSVKPFWKITFINWITNTVKFQIIVKNYVTNMKKWFIELIILKKILAECKICAPLFSMVTIP